MRQRIITGLTLFAGIWWVFANTEYTQLIWGSLIVFFATAWEWGHMRASLPVKQRIPPHSRAFITAAITVIGGMFILYHQSYTAFITLLGAWLWLTIALLIVRQRLLIVIQALPGWLHDIIFLLTLGVAITALFGMGIFAQQANGLLFASLAVVWAADIGAYFTGKAIGSTPLSSLSPKKTWQGAIGGWLCAIVFAVVWVNVYPTSLGMVSVESFIFAAVIAAPMSIIGDLAQSAMKRHYQVKDSGFLLPGHGGVYDRIDGMLAALPLQYSVYLWLN